MRDGRLEKSLDAVIVALCADYDRRQRAIEKRFVSKRTETEYRYLNFKIYDACCEAVGEELCETIIRDIGNKRGYTASELSFLSESTHKIYKDRAKKNIAAKLHLIDKGVGF